jgi:hypothetical protein
MLRVCGPRSRPPADELVINTTSHAGDWEQGLSPFVLGPCYLYDGNGSRNVENGWQYAKLYSVYAHDENEGYRTRKRVHVPTDDYWRWARAGWNNQRAVRYPMGKGAKPLGSWWNGALLQYVEARKEIYIPLYRDAVFRTDAFRRLRKIVRTAVHDVWLWDFDGYDHIAEKQSLEQVFNNPNRKAGHAFVLAMMLE